ncbi:helix-turn-helix domain-containing protein [Streptomyces paromomycinus]|uniref:Transcriptional regulator n=1 Tax=Streptomyces paromomycinus TaxID=92743 RepID=A0A401VXK7_STREY|nr:helix-turn-helix transcriptional regulator [Streptomyces paromomycinus]GCD41775.1 transcriptional regulator [Streptomyces paromomycinus]
MKKTSATAGAGGPAPASGPTTRRRQVGFRLQALRKAAGLSAEEAGELAGISKATVSRYETAKGNVRWNQVDHLCRAYNASDDERAAPVELAKNSKVTDAWWVSQVSSMPSDLGMLIALESEAQRISQFASSVVPGLLQTHDYARGITATPGYEVAPDDLAALLNTRMQRQTLLRRDAPPRYRVILDESVIRRAVGGPTVMAAQLDHLLERAEDPDITIQVLPFARGAYSGALSGFITIGGPDPNLDVVYTETISGSLYLEKPEELTMCAAAFEYLLGEALPPNSSAEMIAEVRKQHLKSEE